MSTKLNDEMSYKILKLLEENPDMSQRQIAQELKISVGKANYCLKTLIDMGIVKTGDFVRSKKKIGSSYLLTPKGVAEKNQITKRFLARKLKQYEVLQYEIEALKVEVNKNK